MYHWPSIIKRQVAGMIGAGLILGIIFLVVELWRWLSS